MRQARGSPSLLRRISVRHVTGVLFIFSVVAIYLQNAVLRDTAQRSFGLLSRAHARHPFSSCPAQPPAPAPTDGSAGEAGGGAPLNGTDYLLRRQHVFVALDESRSALDELLLTERSLLPAVTATQEEAAMAPITAIGSHDEPWTVCPQTRALLAQRPPPAAIWLATFAPPTDAPRDAIALGERTAAAARAEAARAGGSVWHVRLPTALRAHGGLQLALQATTEYVLLLEPRALPSARFVPTALAIARHALSKGEVPPLLGEAGCVVVLAGGAADAAGRAAHPPPRDARRYEHLCTAAADGGVVSLAEPVHVDYLVGFVFSHTSWVRRVLASEPRAPADGRVADNAAALFLAFSDSLRRALGVPTLALPVWAADADARRADGRGARPRALAWPARIGEGMPDAFVDEALRAGMAPTAFDLDGRLRGRRAEPRAAERLPGRGGDGDGGGGGDDSSASLESEPLPAERWLLVADTYVAAHALRRALGSLCAVAAAPAAAAASRGAAAAGGARASRCDLLVVDETRQTRLGDRDLRAELTGGGGGGGGGAAREGWILGDLRWGRVFSVALGWHLAVESANEQLALRRLTASLLHLKAAMRPSLVIAAVDDGDRAAGARAAGARAAGAGAPAARPTDLSAALRAVFGAQMRDAATAYTPAAPALAALGAWDELAGGDGGDGGGAAAGAAPAGAREGQPHGSARVRLPIVLPAAQLASASWIGTLPARALASWNVPSVTILVITWKRPQSLKRLCAALRGADYLGDTVAIRFVMDAGADIETRRLVAAFEWPHGPKTTSVRAEHAGLAITVVESWQPTTDESEYAVLLEDDIEVAPSFYAWLKYALLMYRHGEPAARDPRLIGVSLYTPRIVEVARPRRRLDLFAELGGQPFLQQLPCSWGALFFPEQWRAFRDYLLLRMTQEPPVVVYMPGSVVHGWKGSWKKYLIELMYARAQWMLYPNFRNQTSFSTNHLEAGEHIAAKANSLSHKAQDFTVPLLGRDFVHQLPGQSLARLQSLLPRLDLFSNRTTDDDAVYRGLQLAVQKVPGA